MKQASLLERPVDVAVVGGSFAGLSAALYLARARKTVVVFDTGLTRNRFAGAAHGFLGQDGKSPLAVRMAARADVAAYPTVSMIDDAVEMIVPQENGFRLMPATGAPVLARRVVLAFGMRDILPAIPGLSECWGKTALQCPYCHGFEAAGQPTGILMTGANSLHQAELIREWTDDLVFFANGHVLEIPERAELQASGTKIVDDAVSAVEQRDGSITAVLTQTGGRIAREVLYLTSSARQSSDLAHQLGCAMTEGPAGLIIKVDDLQQTSVPGVYAAGDITRAFYGSTFAAADGVRAAMGCHRSLLAEGRAADSIAA